MRDRIYILCWWIDMRRDGARAARSPVPRGDEEGRLRVPQIKDRTGLAFGTMLESWANGPAGGRLRVLAFGTGLAPSGVKSGIA